MFALGIKSSTAADIRLYTTTFNNHMNELEDLGEHFPEAWNVRNYIRATERLIPKWYFRQRAHQRGPSPPDLLEVQAILLDEADDYDGYTN